MNTAADAYASWLSQSFQSSSYIDPIPVNVITINNNVTKVYPDTELNSLLLSNCYVLFCHLTLNIHSKAYGIYGACELHKQPITHRLDDAATMLADLGTYYGSA